MMLSDNALAAMIALVGHHFTTAKPAILLKIATGSGMRQ
jgi:hypothetical protein